ncbi:Kdo hydroxylase family protein [Candidatus Vallotia tarda]|uniref:3-deoxy-D-manno-oct-2-ulosonic acid (Kdo) hydroxylase n=1 Tax=Candidatus Vallotiella hemipterorum TaxID=1177213 RepID=A0A916NFB1_9BURK|nr:Kdo hydroxylase family protein [Candidatus Vallotia tarda]CAG7597810.1 3-deoxy-D-manno-oct-2-ulosonic acid (Kdo) hydroxylase [Candidatus Vallotia tarda]
MRPSQIININLVDWFGQYRSVLSTRCLALLESGKVLYFPRLRFLLTRSEQTLMDSKIADPKRKNISLEANSSVLCGVLGDESIRLAIHALLSRYQHNTCELVGQLIPEYMGKLRISATSLRLHRVETRKTSWHKDDSRLHIDAFPSQPNYGERILRVFANINSHGEPRVWRVGEPFEDVVQRFCFRIPKPMPGAAWLLKLLHITKTRRSRYDHFMVHLHNAMKSDLDYQRNAQQQTVKFLPGSVWMCFSDQVSHAVMSGQFMLEQTFFLPVRSMAQPHRSPLSILERITGRMLI